LCGRDAASRLRLQVFIKESKLFAPRIQAVFALRKAMQLLRVGEVEVWLACLLERLSKLHGLIWRDLRIVFAVLDQQRRCDPRHISQDVRLAVYLRLFFWSSAHLGGPTDGRRTIGALNK